MTSMNRNGWSGQEKMKRRMSRNEPPDSGLSDDPDTLPVCFPCRGRNPAALSLSQNTLWGYMNRSICSAFLLFGMGCDIILEVLDRVRSVYFRHLFYIDQRFRLHRRFGILGEPSPCPHRTLCTENEYPRTGAKRKRSLISQASLGGGDSWTRTNDPIDVNDVLYRLSHATTLRFEVPTKVSYRLSHATTRLMFRPQGTTD